MAWNAIKKNWGRGGDRRGTGPPIIRINGNQKMITISAKLYQRHFNNYTYCAVYLDHAQYRVALVPVPEKTPASYKLTNLGRFFPGKDGRHRGQWRVSCGALLSELGIPKTHRSAHDPYIEKININGEEKEALIFNLFELSTKAWCLDNDGKPIKGLRAKEMLRKLKASVAEAVGDQSVYDEATRK